MKKKILLIGNNSGLPGVSTDMANYAKFFMSDIGGNWYDGEIETIMNPKKEDLLKRIDLIKAENLDYIFVAFSGHGGQELHTVIELNSKGESIYEYQLKNIAKRQITVLDCCRSYSTELMDKSLRTSLFSERTASYNVREKYEKRLLQAINQQITLYACAKGETATDTSDGGVYTVNLLKAAKQVSEEYVYVGDAHVKAKAQTSKQYPKQNPDAELPRCTINQQLILSINPAIRG